MTTYTRFKLRNGTAAEWSSANPTLLSGEIGVESDTRKHKYGDGVTAWNSLPYAAGSDGGAGTVTSVNLDAPTGFAVAGGPITTAGTITLSYASGYQGYTSAEASRLAGIADGAEANVNADWDATSGDAQILNKPTLGTAAAEDVGTDPGDVVQLDGSGRLPAVDGSQLTGLPSAGGTPGGSDTQVQFNDGGSFGGSADLTWDDTAKELGIGGDINLDDGGTYTTTLQMITPTADRTISFPDATGTVALVAGSNGQFAYNNAGSQAGLSTFTTDGTNLTLSGQWTSTLNGAASAPPVSLTGTWFTGGTSTTTKPQFLVEPTGTTSTAWSTNGTGFGVNAPSGFSGNLLDLQVGGVSALNVTPTAFVGPAGNVIAGGYPGITLKGATNSGLAANSGNLSIWAQGKLALNFANNEVRFAKDWVFSWSSAANNNAAADLIAGRDDANIFAQRRGTNAQTFRCYGTYTNASNYVRAALSSTSTAVTLAAETAGTGADDIPLNLTAAGAGTVKVNSVAEIAVSSTVAGLPATPTVGMVTRVTDGDSGLTFGNTVVNSGAGATPYLVWYNGTNWTILGA